MRRTQLYLDDHLWNALHSLARSRKTSISELVREAARERYLGDQDQRRNAMQAFVGIRKDRSKSFDAAEYVRSLRRGNRLDELHKK
ncbi:MAG TPA: CopG family transcriptional regulator [Bryobacteraceae bacterium]|jgi:metal-responsive CopG/Arc/MetJ family transcriptional regulator|nr:CopG family transcriptional regulator [Bryobacteraceae bacterium]